MFIKNGSALGNTIDIFGMEVADNDLIHADRHGAVVIPKAVAEIPVAIDLVLRREKVILDACAEPGFSAEKLRIAMADSSDIH